MYNIYNASILILALLSSWVGCSPLRGNICIYKNNQTVTDYGSLKHVLKHVYCISACILLRFTSKY